MWFESAVCRVTGIYAYSRRCWNSATLPTGGDHASRFSLLLDVFIRFIWIDTFAVPIYRNLQKLRICHHQTARLTARDGLLGLAEFNIYGFGMTTISGLVNISRSSLYTMRQCAATTLNTAWFLEIWAGCVRMLKVTRVGWGRDAL